MNHHKLWYIFQTEDGKRLISQVQWSFLELIGEYYNETESPGLAFMDWFASKYAHTTLVVTATPHLMLAKTWELHYDVQ